MKNKRIGAKAAEHKILGEEAHKLVSHYRCRKTSWTTSRSRSSRKNSKNRCTKHLLRSTRLKATPGLPPVPKWMQLSLHSVQIHLCSKCSHSLKFKASNRGSRRKILSHLNSFSPFSLKKSTNGRRSPSDTVSRWRSLFKKVNPKQTKLRRKLRKCQQNSKEKSRNKCRI